MILFYLIGKYFWFICILLQFILFSTPKEIRKMLEKDEGFKYEFYSLRRKLLIITIFPWLIMGVSILSGEVPSFWHYFRPQDGNPFVLLFFTSVITIWIITLYWTFFRNGAEIITKFKLLSFYVFGEKRTLTSSQVKLFLVLGIFGGIMGIIFMLVFNYPIPDIMY